MAVISVDGIFKFLGEKKCFHFTLDWLWQAAYHSSVLSDDLISPLTPVENLKLIITWLT